MNAAGPSRARRLPAAILAALLAALALPRPSTGEGPRENPHDFERIGCPHCHVVHSGQERGMHRTVFRKQHLITEPGQKSSAGCTNRQLIVNNKNAARTVRQLLFNLLRDDLDRLRERQAYMENRPVPHVTVGLD